MTIENLTNENDLLADVSPEQMESAIQLLESLNTNAFFVRRLASTNLQVRRLYQQCQLFAGSSSRKSKNNDSSNNQQQQQEQEQEQETINHEVEVAELQKSIARESRKQKREVKKDNDRQMIENCGIKKLRTWRMDRMHSNGSSMPVVMPEYGEFMINSKTLLLTENTDPNPTETTSEASNETTSQPQLSTAKCCHICHAQYRQLHHFYDQLCPDCSEFNFQKRLSTIDLNGKVAIVTGGRVKIGFCVALKLLRSGCHTIVTTRFPRDCEKRYQQEADYLEFKDRLFIYGLDFRDLTMVHRFCAHVKLNFHRLDIIINNSAQTVRRPPAYYRHLLEGEVISDDKGVKSAIVDYAEYQPRDLKALKNEANETNESSETTATETETLIANSALMSQRKLINEDTNESQLLFPPGALDIDSQQVDLRQQNSWTMKLGEVSAVELIECHAINSFAPFIINSELRSMMCECDDCDVAEEQARDGRYIVNVSAMEGQFYRHKTPFHPHTNMAKASMNMLTRTSAQECYLDGIYMNSVDTGWITDEHPAGKTKMYTEPPLDEWDAAMRILDPVFEGIRDPCNRNYGVFFKNYKPTRW